MATMNVSLPHPMREWVEAQVKGGEYANASDYIRDLIRHDQERRKALEAAIDEGLKSGRSRRKAEAVMAAAKAERHFRARAARAAPGRAKTILAKAGRRAKPRPDDRLDADG